MKTNNRFTTAGHDQRSTKGFTLIEITLVISLLLGLISVLFIGIQAYRAGSNQALCLLTQVTCQKAVRSYSNLAEVPIGGSATETQVCGVGLYVADPGPTCPGGGTYTYGDVVPAEGQEWLVCSLASHQPTSTNGW
jgi:type II secretory pathway pseudopilin PulG